MNTLTCGLCQQTFTEADSAVACARCALAGGGGCQKVRCPHCGYEMPAPARLPKLVGGLIRKITGKKHGE